MHSWGVIYFNYFNYIKSDKEKGITAGPLFKHMAMWARAIPRF